MYHMTHRMRVETSTIGAAIEKEECAEVTKQKAVHEWN